MLIVPLAASSEAESWFILEARLTSLDAEILEVLGAAPICSVYLHNQTGLPLLWSKAAPVTKGPGKQDWSKSA